MKPALDKQQMNLKQQLQNIAFEKKSFFDRYINNVIYQFQSFNGQDKPVRSYGRQQA